MKISFIIPFYNGGKYITDCLNSLCAQDVPASEYEIIVVDDCSPNKEDVELLENYAATCPNMRIIHNKRNLRCGGSRNEGLLHAKGEYIWFVDQDDYIKPNCLGDIIKLCSENKLDILYLDYRDVSDDLSLSKKRNIVTKISDVKSGLDYINDDCKGDFWHSGYDTNVWHSVYRRDFMITNNIFSPEVSYCEDMIVSQHAIIVAKRFMAIPNDYYCYRYNPASVFHTEVGVKGRPLFDASIYAGSEIVKLAELIPAQHQSLHDTVKSGGVHRINSFTKQLLKITSQQRRIFFEMVNKYADVVNSAKPYLKPLNRWLISHPVCVKMIPHIIYVYIKLLKKS